MRRLLAALVVVLLALPSTPFAVEPSGAPVLERGDASPSGSTPKAWGANDIFFVRAQTCRTVGIFICGPDPLIASGANFSGVIRIFIPVTDLYTIYFFVTDPEGAVIVFTSMSANLFTASFNDF